MTPENFTYWLQGFVELNGSPPTQEQWNSIKEHLKLVFTKVTPPVQPTIDIPKWSIDPRFTNPPTASAPPIPLPTTTCSVASKDITSTLTC